MKFTTKQASRYFELAIWMRLTQVVVGDGGHHRSHVDLLLREGGTRRSKSGGLGLAAAAILVPMLLRRRLDGRALLVGGDFYLVHVAVVVSSLLEVKF